MKRCLVGLIASMAMLLAGPADACGDKFLVGNNTADQLRWQTQIQPGHILIYAGDGLSASDWMQKRASLEERGHTVVIVEDPETMMSTLSSEPIDLVMMDVAAAREMRSKVEAASEQAIILPYVNFGTRSEVSKAKKEFGRAVQTPATMRKLEKAIYSALAVAVGP